jgi:hypothetical protein
LEFNKAARSLLITNELEVSSNFKAAQLSYHEAFLIFKEFSNQRKEGVCISNIGRLQMLDGEFSKALASFNLAITTQE